MLGNICPYGNQSPQQCPAGYHVDATGQTKCVKVCYSTIGNDTPISWEGKTKLLEFLTH